MSDDLLARLREAALSPADPYRWGVFTPEQVQRGLEAALNKAGDLTAGAVSLAFVHGLRLPEDAHEQCIKAFLEAVRDA